MPLYKTLDFLQGFLVHLSADLEVCTSQNEWSRIGAREGDAQRFM